MFAIAHFWVLRDDADYCFEVRLYIISALARISACVAKFIGAFAPELHRECHYDITGTFCVICGFGFALASGLM